MLGGPDGDTLFVLTAPGAHPDVVSGAAEAGVTSFRVLPLFLAPQGHVEKDVRPLTEEVPEMGLKGYQGYPSLEKSEPLSGGLKPARNF